MKIVDKIKKKLYLKNLDPKAIDVVLYKETFHNPDHIMLKTKSGRTMYTSICDEFRLPDGLKGKLVVSDEIFIMPLSNVPYYIYHLDVE